MSASVITRATSGGCHRVEFAPHVAGDTVATRVAGKTVDRCWASAQLGHSDGAGVALKHYVDQAGCIHVVVDHSDELVDLALVKVGARLESVAWVSHSE
ncbi:hypothetical protein AB0I30_22735 [Nocardia tengchongensis]|uniref:hypothetical protein n=1 Tax=Nocardia tengchongensis TaxID=2055889 RepID=UPI0033D5AA97